MRNYLLSDAAGKTSNGWRWFETLQNAMHHTGQVVGRHMGQSWADYMDDLEEHQLLQRRQLRRRMLKMLLLAAICVLAFATLNM